MKLSIYEAEREYLNLLQDLVQTGIPSKDRTGVGTRRLFGRQLRFPISADTFPLLTTKFVWFKGVLHELLWFISGDTNIRYLVKNGVHIWDEWAFQRYLERIGMNTLTTYSEEWNNALKVFTQRIIEDEQFAFENGDLGPVYGRQWRNFNSFDQLAWVINEIKANPDSRRLIVNSWNAAEVHSMALPPCHLMYQFFVLNGKISCQVYIRSWDVFLGGPFNIASYALLLLMVAQVTGFEPNEMVITSGDTHLYENHIVQAEAQIQRMPYPPPQITINPDIKFIDDFTFGDFQLVDYKHHPAIKADIAV